MPNELQQVAETGGSVSIAGAIVFAAIKLGPHFANIVRLLYAIWEQREIKQEQEHRRDKKRRRVDSTQPPMRGVSKMPSVDEAPEFIREESTDVIDIREAVRKRAPRGFRPPTRGEHHDGEE